MSETLKGEGEVTSYIKVRRECEECEEYAVWRFTYLLPNARSNPASKAYGRDDCSWCSDTEEFYCAVHGDEARRRGHTPDGYRQCSYFPCEERFAHMFLRNEKMDKEV